MIAKPDKTGVLLDAAILTVMYKKSNSYGLRNVI